MMQQGAYARQVVAIGSGLVKFDELAAEYHSLVPTGQPFWHVLTPMN
jgi:hypothetical protein